MSIASILFFLGGLVLLIAGAEILVRGASRLAFAAGISPLVVGLTVVAFGTSAPELAVSVQSALNQQAGIALGNVVGSNIANVLLILGVSALITPLVVDAQLVRLDVPLLIGISLLVVFFAANGVIGRAEGGVLFAGVLIYTVFLIRQSRRATQQAAQANSSPEGQPTQHLHAPPRALLLPNLGLVVVGLIMLVIGARWLVNAAVTFAQAMGISELVIGLTIVAVGTSLPEVATSVIAAVRGERDIAVGNVVGSNIFNLLAVLGLTSLIAPAGIPVPTTALVFDLPVMTLVAIACLPIFFTGYRIARWEGFIFLGYYVAYIAYLVLQGAQSDSLVIFRQMLIYFAAPLTLITLAVTLYREFRRPPVAPV